MIVRFLMRVLRQRWAIHSAGRNEETHLGDDHHVRMGSGVNGTAAWGARIYGDNRRMGDSVGRLGRGVLEDSTGEQRASGMKGVGRFPCWKVCARSGGTHAPEACAGACAVMQPPRED
jgi:hypothetical protein